MSALESHRNSLAGLTLDAVLGGENRAPTLVTRHPSRTLLDIIREENKEGHRDKKTWKTFRDKLRLKRTGSAWTSSLPIPTSDIPIANNNNRNNSNRFSRRGSFQSISSGSVHEATHHRQVLIDTVPMSDPPAPAGRALFTRGASMRIGSTHHDDPADVSMPGDGPSSRSFKPQISRNSSIRMPPSNTEQQSHRDGAGEMAAAYEMRRPAAVTFADERTLSAREAVVAQEAAEAEAAAAAATEKEEDEESDETAEKATAEAVPQPVTMSLMDLLEETDRQMGLTGSRYAMDDDDNEYDEEEEDGSEEEVDGSGGGGELSCCVCMVKIKGASFIPCGHTFCRLCSRELMVQKGHCPVCSSFVLEFLEIF